MSTARKIIAIGLWAGVVFVGPSSGFAQPVEQDQRRDAGARPSNQASEEDVNVVATHLSRVAGALEAQNAESDATAEDERARRDLKAQENMAQWAGLMLIPALLQTILSAVAVGLIYVTFRQTRRAADSAEKMATESRKATKAALKAAAAAKQTLTESVRPYLSITEAKEIQLLQSQTAGSLKLFIANHGNATAIVEEGFAEIKLIRDGETIPLPPILDVVNRQTLGGGYFVLPPANAGQSGFQSPPASRSLPKTLDNFGPRRRSLTSLAMHATGRPLELCARLVSACSSIRRARNMEALAASGSCPTTSATTTATLMLRKILI